MEDLDGRVTDCSKAGFARAMDVSVHSFVRMAKLAEPLMSNGGCLLTVSYYGAEKVIDHYNVMGPVKSALEGTVRYLASELGTSGIRVNAISPGPLKTRAATGIDHFDVLIEAARMRAPNTAWSVSKMSGPSPWALSAISPAMSPAIPPTSMPAIT